MRIRSFLPVSGPVSHMVFEDAHSNEEVCFNKCWNQRSSGWRLVHLRFSGGPGIGASEILWHWELVPWYPAA